MIVITSMREQTDEHIPLGTLAVVVLCTFVIGYPAVTFWRMRHITKANHHSERTLLRWSHFTHDYTARRFWFRHVTFALVALLLLLNEFATPGVARSVAIAILLLLFSVVNFFLVTCTCPSLCESVIG